MSASPAPSRQCTIGVGLVPILAFACCRSIFWFVGFMHVSRNAAAARLVLSPSLVTPKRHEKSYANLAGKAEIQGAS